MIKGGVWTAFSHRGQNEVPERARFYDEHDVRSLFLFFSLNFTVVT